MKNIPTYLLLLAALAACEDDDDVLPENPADAPYTVDIDPDDFESSGITGNLYFPLITGKTYVYEGTGEDGEKIRVVTEYTAQTKTIMGITCVVVHDQEYEDEQLIEDTFDWYAQDKEGNVWYFGEATQEIENGAVVGTSGSWEAGIDGALPGIIMLANPLPSLWYRQEYLDGEAEDVGQVLNTSASIQVPYGSFDNCLQSAEWNLLEPGIVEHKYYAPGLGLIKTIAVKGESGFEDLVEVQ
jgi:hypothetical protein